uniref:RXT2_N domain-containing protein n=1 Tax=Elaeophora elaphi TaxID=1147741 RepID=A0A0R3RVE2_9BILA
MQNIRGRARLLGRRHARVHFNLGTRLRSSTSHENFPEDKTRDAVLKQILEDSLAATRTNHERYLLDDLIDYVESLVDDGMELQIVLDKDTQRWYAKRLKRNLLNWIARNETELAEIDALERRVTKRYLQINRENSYLQRIFKDMKFFTNLTSDRFKNTEISFQPTSVDTSKTQSSSSIDESEE